MKLSVIMPAYNEEKTIEQVIGKVKGMKLPSGTGLEIIVVDDFSTDSTPQILKKIKGITVLRNDRNRGKGYSVRKAIRKSSGDVIVFQDADLEYDPQQIPILLKEIMRGKSVVYGSRFMGRIRSMSFSHYVGNRIISFVTSVLFGQKITDTETCYKMFRRSALEGIELRSNKFDIEIELTAKFLKKGLRIKEVPIDYRARRMGDKKINWKDGVKAVFYLFKFRFRD